MGNQYDMIIQCLRHIKFVSFPLTRSGELIEVIQNDSVMRWSHFNLGGEYDFSDEKMVDSVGLDVPKKRPTKFS